MRLSGMNLKAIAAELGESYGYLRKVCSKDELNSAAKVRREVVKRFQGNGTPADIAEFLRLYHGQNVKADAIRALMRRMFRPKQLSLWPDTMFRVAPPPMRVVHRKKHLHTRSGVQLDLFTEIEKLRAA